MATYIAQRLIWAVFVLVVVASVAFLLTFVAPADPARSIAGPNATAAAVERIREALHLDRPALAQLADYFAKLAQGNLGSSFKHGGIPVLDLIVAKLLPTIELAIAGLAVSLAIGIPLGVRSSRKPGGALDRVAGVASSVLVSIPSFFLGLLLLYWVSYQWHVLPMPNSDYDPLDLRALALPALTLGLAAAPFYVRVTRSLMIDEFHMDYVRTARAKGVPSRDVAWRHAFRNALPPIVTLAGLDLGFYLGGVVVIESVFGWPGIGLQAVKAITEEDLPLLMGTLLFGTLCIVIANLVVDVIHAMLDPRVTIGAEL